MSKGINAWTSDQLIQWVNQQSFNSVTKQKIIAGINEHNVKGSDIALLEDASEVDDYFKVKGADALTLLNLIDSQKDADFKKTTGADDDSKNDWSDDRAFDLNFSGQKQQCCKLESVRLTDKLGKVKERWLKTIGAEIDDQNNGYKFSKQIEKVTFHHHGVSLGSSKNKSTLKQCGFNFQNVDMEVYVVFQVPGGMAAPRIRKIRKKKHNLVLSKEPDYLMGYTDDDGVERAKMPCGCAFAADTMYRYLKSKCDGDNARAITILCPMKKASQGGRCKGTDTQRLWPFSLMFAVADLTPEEVKRYSEVIEERNGLGKPKKCPHCGAFCEREPDLRIWRVRCVQCNGSDWCWHCCKVWNKSGSLVICGNSGCAGTIKSGVNDWAKGDDVPLMRACPKCLTLIEYTQRCQHMCCIACPHQFCFKCLGDWEPGRFGVHNHCAVQSFQTQL
jgi:hypothetical protein